MTPLEVLRCATVNGSRIIGRPADLGSIEPGKLADLVIIGQEAARRYPQHEHDSLGYEER